MDGHQSSSGLMVVDELMNGIATLSRADQARIVGTNAVEAYHLPVAVGA
jgi:hypothetical protein